jgi:DNA-binding transcriptional ArsR family regulator
MTAATATPNATAALGWEVIARRVMHPTAVAILELLAAVADQDQPERTPRDFAGVLHVPLGSVAYHVRMLRDRGLIELMRTEPRRGALAHFYVLAPDTLKGESP